jgi:hypothetical protein
MAARGIDSNAEGGALERSEAYFRTTEKICSENMWIKIMKMNELYIEKIILVVSLNLLWRRG